MNLPLSAVCALLASPFGFGQSTWIVDATGTGPGSGTANDPYTTIQYAIDQSATLPGDTVLVSPGTYTGAVDFLGKELRIASSSGADSTIIEATGSVVTAKSGEGPGTEIEGFTIRGGTGALYTYGLNSTRRVGGGVYVQDSQLLVRDCIVTGNTAEVGGGLCSNGGELRVVGCEVTDNEVSRMTGTFGGGGIASIEGSLSLADTTVAGNVARATGSAFQSSRRGGGIMNGLIVSGVPSSIRMTDCLVENNRVEPHGDGGGAFIVTFDGLMDRCVVRGNSTGAEVTERSEGAGLFIADLEATPLMVVRDSTIEGNGSGTTGRGGGFFGGARLEGCIIRNNEAALGGGVFNASGNDERSELVDCVLEGNRSEHSDSELPSGAGAHGADLTDCTLRGNHSSNSGGAATNCVLNGCKIEDNSAGALLPNSFGIRGGALLDCIATDCTLVGNVLDPCLDLNTDGGGAAYASTLTRCLIIGSKIGDPGLGAATAGCDLDSCTVYGSEYLNGWGYAISGPATVHNTIVWGNATNLDIGPYSPIPVLSYSDVEEGLMPGPGNISTAPDFWAPDRLDFHLRPGSRGIDEGDPASPLDPDGSAIEMGALPFDADYYGLPTNYCTAKVNSLGCSAAMDFAGTPSLTGPDDFELTATGLPNSAFAIPVWSLSPGATPLGGGLLCVGSPFIRSAIAQASPNPAGSCEGGAIASPFDQAKMATNGLVAGSRIYAQLWYRDNLPDGTGFALTDGLDFTIRP